MTLEMRPANSEPNGDWEYTVYCGNLAIGRICEVIGSRPETRWFWTFYMIGGPMRRYGRASTLEKAKAEFSASWEVWKEWAGLEERD
jgi:hypothetical protein